jgi:hypothetical protein
MASLEEGSPQAWGVLVVLAELPAAAPLQPLSVRALSHATRTPFSLDPVEPLARAVYESGWRPTHGPGPTRDELVDILEAAHYTDR